MKLSIVIPAYNEAENVEATLDELSSKVKDIFRADDFEIIVVDDCSSDDTYGRVVSIGDPRIGCIRLSRRSGSHTALRAGIKESAGDAVLCISADGQDDPSCLGEMVRKWEKGASVVWALRKSRHDEVWYRRQLSQAFYRILFWLARVEYKNIDYSRANFFLLSRPAVDALNACPERNTSLFGLICWIGFNQDFVEYERRQRRTGVSRWSFRGQLQLARDWIIAFSGVPLFATAVLGVLMTFAGMFYTLFLVVTAVGGSGVSGWSAAIAVAIMICGVQITILGVLGEYIWRNLDESRKRPLYFVEKRSQKG